VEKFRLPLSNLPVSNPAYNRLDIRMSVAIGWCHRTRGAEMASEELTRAIADDGSAFLIQKEGLGWRWVVVPAEVRHTGYPFPMYGWTISRNRAVKVVREALLTGKSEITL
jgi:hypothetical protein